MIRFFLIVCAALLSLTDADAQLLLTHAGGSAGAAPCGGYAGPGDAVSGAQVWYGLRAYSCSYAQSGGKAATLRRASDSTACDFDVASTGGLGNSDSGCSLGGGLSLASFATQDATATCTIATTTATCTGASSTPHVGSTITGTGVTQPCWASAVGTFTGGAGTVTLSGTGSSPCGTIGSGETMTFAYALYVTQLYDQSGGKLCSSGTAACPVSNATTANQPQLLPSCLNGLPCMAFNGSSSRLFQQNSSTFVLPRSFSAVAMGTGTTNVSKTINSDSANSGANRYGYQMLWNGNTSIAAVYAVNNNTYSTGSANSLAQNIWAVEGGVFTSTTSRTAYLNGSAGTTDTSSLTVTGTVGINTIGAISESSALDFFLGYIAESGEWGSALSGANMTSLCHNEYSYWGTATSC